MIAQRHEAFGDLMGQLKRTIVVNRLAHHAVILVRDGDGAFLVDGVVVALNLPTDHDVSFGGLTEAEREGGSCWCFVERVSRLGNHADAGGGVIPLNDCGVV